MQRMIDIRLCGSFLQGVFYKTRSARRIHSALSPASSVVSTRVHSTYRKRLHMHTGRRIMYMYVAWMGSRGLEVALGKWIM
jgi:hypothetical protein